MSQWHRGKLITTISRNLLRVLIKRGRVLRTLFYKISRLHHPLCRTLGPVATIDPNIQLRVRQTKLQHNQPKALKKAPASMSFSQHPHPTVGQGRQASEWVQEAKSDFVHHGEGSFDAWSLTSLTLIICSTTTCSVPDNSASKQHNFSHKAIELSTHD